MHEKGGDYKEIIMIEMFKIMKGRDKISEDKLFNRVDSDRTRGHSLRVKKRRVNTVVRQETFYMSSHTNFYSESLMHGMASLER